jgi:hypothetical protein
MSERFQFSLARMFVLVALVCLSARARVLPIRACLAFEGPLG